MYTVYAVGWEVSDWRNRLVNRHNKGDNINHLTLGFETKITKNQMILTWGERGLEFFSEPRLVRAWGEPRKVLLGQAPSLGYGTQPDYHWSQVPANLLWHYLGRPGWWRPTSCVTVCQAIAEDLGLDWSPVPGTFSMARLATSR